MGSTTTNLGLYKPATNENGWSSSVNANWDTLDTLLANGVGSPAGPWTRVKTSTSAGATSIVLDPAPALISNLSQCVILIGVGTNTWDAQLITPANVSGNTVGVSAMTNAHTAGESVAVLSVRQPVPFSWLGAIDYVNGNSNSAATRNVAVFNRMMGHGGVQSNLGGFNLVVDGLYYTNDMLQMQGGTTRLAGLSRQNSGDGFIARSGFPFTSDGAVQMLDIVDQHGTGNSIKAGYNGDITTWIEDLAFDGNDLSGAVGLVHCPQQPGHAYNLRFHNFAGLAGYAFGGQNYWDVENFQCDHCHCGILIQHIIFSVRNWNSTSPTVVGGTAYGMRLAGFSGVVIGGDPEDIDASGVLISMEGGGGYVFDSIWTSGLDSGSTGTIIQSDGTNSMDGRGCSYEIRNFLCNQGASMLKILRDVQRGFSIQGFSGDINARILDARARGDYYEWLTTTGWQHSTTSSGLPHAA